MPKHYKTAQKAQNPGVQGRGQSQVVSTHEGSQLGKPTVAKNAEKAMPADKQAQS